MPNAFVQHILKFLNTFPIVSANIGLKSVSNISMLNTIQGTYEQCFWFTAYKSLMYFFSHD